MGKVLEIDQSFSLCPVSEVYQTSFRGNTKLSTLKKGYSIKATQKKGIKKRLLKKGYINKKGYLIK